MLKKILLCGTTTIGIGNTFEEFIGIEACKTQFMLKSLVRSSISSGRNIEPH